MNSNAVPPCPAWCECDHDGWDIRPSATTKTCLRVIALDVGSIVLERFANLARDGCVHIDAPILRLELDTDVLTSAAGIRVSETMRRAAEMLREPQAVAA